MLPLRPLGVRPVASGRYAEALRQNGSKSAAARAMGISRASFNRGMDRESKRMDVTGGMYDFTTPQPEAEPALPTFPDKHAPIETIISRLIEDTERRERREQEEKWFKIYMPDDRPFGMLCFGDPHLGTSTNWPRLTRDVELCKSTPGLYGLNIGDTTNNWAGRLIREYAEEDISRKTERRLAKWFMAEAGIKWLVWLMGNHDEWQDGADILRLMNIRNRVTMLNWSAKFELHFPNGQKVRIHAAHDFPGHSMWNITHGPARATRMFGSDADLYVCGHRHDWGIQQFEMSDRGQCPMAIRARGYKRHDFWAKTKGFQESTYGASIMTIIDPTAGPAGRVLAFADTDQGARVLNSLRGPARAPASRKAVPKSGKRRKSR